VDVSTIEVDGRPARHRAFGSGEPLVLLHGLAGSWRWWFPLCDALGNHRRVYVPDLPGPRADLPPSEIGSWVSRWLDAAGLEQTDLAGHSLGGMYAAHVAATEPHRIRRLALVSPAGIPAGGSLVRRFMPLAGALADVRASLPTVVADAVRAGPIALARQIAFVSHLDLRAELAAIEAPTLLVWGERDRLVPAQLGQEWQQRLRSARLVRLHCGHVPMLEAPDELAWSMLSFLEGELPHDVGDELGPRVVNGVRLGGHDEQPAVR
jgi:pimeloyl-ACP methyl ester carboxylesterase